MRKILLLIGIVLGLSQPLLSQTVTFLSAGTDSTFDTLFYTGSSGTVTSSTTCPRTGPRSLALDTGATPTAAQIDTPSTSILLDSGSQVSVGVCVSALPAADSVIFAARQAGGTVWTVTLKTTGALTLTGTGVTASTGTTVLSTSTQYRLTVSYYITNTTTFVFKLYINGAIEATVDSAIVGGTLTRTTATFIRLQANANAGTNHIHYFDDLYIATGGASSSSQPDTGDVHVTAKRPVSNGTSVQFVTEIGSGPAPNGTGSGHAPNVSERALSTSFGWSKVNPGGSNFTEEYNVEGVAVGDVDITGKTVMGVVGWIYAGSSVSEVGKIILQGDASTNASLTSTPTMFTKVGTATYPAGSGTDIGYLATTDMATVSLYEAGIVVAYNGASSSPVCGALAALGVGPC